MQLGFVSLSVAWLLHLATFEWHDLAVSDIELIVSNSKHYCNMIAIMSSPSECPLIDCFHSMFWLFSHPYHKWVTALYSFYV